jgi:hypothetical protein
VVTTVTPTRLEREALKRAISKVEATAWRVGLLRQIDKLRVKTRTEKIVGYYVDFECPAELRVPNLPDDFNKAPPEVTATHPDVSGAIFFVVYVRLGAIDFLESSSTAGWPVDEDQIVFLD